MSHIVPPAPDNQVANYSSRRLTLALKMLRQMRAEMRALSPGARELYAIGLLVADDRGFMRKADLERATQDPSAVQAARNLLRKAAI